ncbi:unnamed protein product [Protopolystoma xenopodis]|uniref:Uncharacterized protein n=1 Tax=Protopolystoma xenopodis TaxID=117903 RepID=A0A3S5B9G1_9PLAT|nr:unnamed protein product [Protopolystoma xenopodis]
MSEGCNVDTRPSIKAANRFTPSETTSKSNGNQELEKHVSSTNFPPKGTNQSNANTFGTNINKNRHLPPPPASSQHQQLANPEIPTDSADTPNQLLSHPPGQMHPDQQYQHQLRSVPSCMAGNSKEPGLRSRQDLHAPQTIETQDGAEKRRHQQRCGVVKCEIDTSRPEPVVRHHVDVR